MLTSSYTKPQHLFFPSLHTQSSSSVQATTAMSSVSLSPSIQPNPAPLLRFPSKGGGGIINHRRTSLKFHDHKEKVVIVMGATGTGKSKLSIDLATKFAGEIVNSDKIQLYSGLDIVTNKVTPQQCQGIPHHLLGILDNDDDSTTDFTSTDFCNLATISIESITARDRVPIIAGGSNSLIDALVNNHASFSKRYECCFLWVDVALPVLGSFISDRVDRMVKQGMIDEVSEVFDPRGDYNKGIRRAIGVPEMHKFFLEAKGNDGCDKAKLSDLLEEGVIDIKGNTYRLACKQLERIQRLTHFWGWDVHYIDATEVFNKRRRKEKGNNQAWEELVVTPSAMIVEKFLNGSVRYSSASSISHVPNGIPRSLPVPAMAAAASY